MRIDLIAFLLNEVTERVALLLLHRIDHCLACWIPLCIHERDRAVIVHPYRYLHFDCWLRTLAGSPTLWTTAAELRTGIETGAGDT